MENPTITLELSLREIYLIQQGLKKISNGYDGEIKPLIIKIEDIVQPIRNEYYSGN